MPKKKKGPIRKTKKKPTRPAKQARGKTPAPKKKPVRNRSRSAGVLTVELSEIEVIGEVEDDSGGDETEAVAEDEEHYPPEYGGSE